MLIYYYLLLISKAETLHRIESILCQEQQKWIVGLSLFKLLLLSSKINASKDLLLVMVDTVGETIEGSAGQTLGKSNILSQLPSSVKGTRNFIYLSLTAYHEILERVVWFLSAGSDCCYYPMFQNKRGCSKFVIFDCSISSQKQKNWQVFVVMRFIITEQQSLSTLYNYGQGYST